MPFVDELKKAFGDAENGATTTAANEYRAVLEDVTTFLAGEGIGAFIKAALDARKLTLYVHPVHRPARCSAMLVFFLEGDAIRVFGEKQELLKTPDELKQRLIEFVTLPAFVESVKILRSEADQAVEARVRVSKEQTFSKGDVMVAVSAADQAKLSLATPNAAVELDVERIDFPGNPALSHDYQVLDSAGVRVLVQQAAVQGSTLKIKGTKVG
jgi:hypothetical protein